MKYFAFIIIFLSLGLTRGFTQIDTAFYKLTLDDVIDLAITQSAAVKYSQNSNVNYYWRYKNFKSRFRPQLVLNGRLPDYRHTTQAITQPDGSVQFRQVSRLAASSTLSLNQSIPQLGTNIWAQTSAYGNKNLSQDDLSFSGSPFVIGFSQPLGYNWMKWYRKTEPMIYDEAQKRFIEEIEQISLNATNRYFSYLSVQTNYKLAESNLQNSQNNMKIAEARQALGQISENDFSRVQLSVLNAQKSMNQARMDLKNADFSLKSYIGLEQEREISLEIPLDIHLFEIDPDLALLKAKENRKETTNYERRLLNADRDLAAAKSETGLSATLSGSFGLSNSADDLMGIYKNPERDRTVLVSLSIPILDWGNSASAVKLAESERELTIFDVNRDIEEFDREIVVQVEQFSLLEDQLKTANEADNVAENGYEIALKKFQNGELSINDLNIALQERERAKRDYVNSIRSYWVAYYRLRILTLYDFERGQNISYDNPML